MSLNLYPSRYLYGTMNHATNKKHKKKLKLDLFFKACIGKSAQYQW